MTATLSDIRLTNLLAEGTGEVLKGVRGVGLIQGEQLAQAGDELAQDWIARVLAQHRPDDGFLSEEAHDDPSRLDKKRVWIVDPLDGTKEFAAGRHDWAIHIALVENEVPVHAAVGLPDLGVVFRSSQVRAVTGPLSRTIIVSRNRRVPVADYVAEQMGFSMTKMGSAGVKAMKVVLGDADAYIHSGGQYEWDQAAPVRVAAAAGLHVSRLDGSAHRFNQRDTYVPDLLICRPELATEILSHVAAYAARNETT